MRVLYMYHPSEPRFGAIVPGSLPQPHLAYRGAVPLQLMQRMPTATTPSTPNVAAAAEPQRIELLNVDVPMPLRDETLQWCRVFELPAELRRRKNHMVRYAPAFGSARSRQQLDQIVLYECQGTSARLAALANAGEGRPCSAMQPQRAALPCNAIVASWTRGSAGLVLPPEAGIPLDGSKERFYLMESHYSNRDGAAPSEEAAEDEWLGKIGHTAAGPLLDDSGLSIYVTGELRQHDAGVLSLGKYLALNLCTHIRPELS